MVYSGMGPDYRVLVDRARKVSHTAYKRIYNEYPPTRILVQDVARVMQEATQQGGVRPYGVSAYSTIDVEGDHRGGNERRDG